MLSSCHSGGSTSRALSFFHLVHFAEMKALARDPISCPTFVSRELLSLAMVNILHPGTCVLPFAGLVNAKFTFESRAQEPAVCCCRVSKFLYLPDHSTSLHQHLNEDSDTADELSGAQLLL